MLIFFYLKVKPTSIEIPPVIPNCMVGTRRDINPRQQTPNILIKNTKKKESGVWGRVIDLTHLSKTVERQTTSITEEVLSNERREDTPPVKTL